MTLADELEAHLAAKETTADQMARWVFLNADAIIAALRAQEDKGEHKP